MRYVPLPHRMKFQSTHSRGVRLISDDAILALSDFNPRTHEECDWMANWRRLSLTYFNPRTHEECDTVDSETMSVFKDFNPRTHEECDEKIN